MYYLALCKFPIIAHVCILRSYHALACMYVCVCTIAYSLHVATYSTALHLTINIFLTTNFVTSSLYLRLSTQTCSSMSVD